jgi:hypothetical protein
MFLTDLRGFDVVIGKLAASSLNGVFAMIGAIPPMALALMFGGVTGGELFRVGLLLLNTLFLTMSISVLVSTAVTEERTAFVRAAGFIVLIVLAPQVAGFVPGAGVWVASLLLPLSPWTPFGAAFDLAYRADSIGFWASLGVQNAIAWVFLIGACFKIGHVWRVAEQPVETSRVARRIRVSVRSLRLLQDNPFDWLCFRDIARTRVWKWLYLMGVVAAWGAAFAFGWIDNTLFIVLSPISLVGGLGMLVILAVSACQTFSESRRTGALELMLTTPLSPESMIAGQWAALRRNMHLPLSLLGVMDFVAFVAICALDSGGRGALSNTAISGAFVLRIVYLVLFIANFRALGWLGMWTGLTEPKGSKAIAKTLFFVLGIPLVSSVAVGIGQLACIFIPVLWIHWAKKMVQTEFRQSAVRALSSSEDATGWLPYGLIYATKRRTAAPSPPLCASPPPIPRG